MARFQRRQSRASDGITALVSLEVMKEHLIEYDTDRDDTITALIASCTADLQQLLGFYIDTTGVITQYYDEFKSVMRIFHPFIKSDSGDVAVKYLDSSGSWTTVDSSYYRIMEADMPPCIILKTGYTWPDPVDEPSSVKIEFKALTTHVAWNSFKQCIKEMVAEAFENPEGSWHSASMESAVTRVVNAYRIRS